MRKQICCLLSVAALLVLGGISPAAADVGDHDIGATRLHGGLWLGFGGDADVDGDNEFAGDLETTVGGQFGVDRLVSRYFSVGAEARIGRVGWQQFDNSKLIDLDFKPRLMLPVTESFELYAAVPVGVTIPALSEVANAPDGKTGWNIGAGAGATLFLTDHFGINAEPMWIMHDFGSYQLQQFSLFLNAVVAL